MAVTARSDAAKINSRAKTSIVFSKLNVVSVSNRQLALQRAHRHRRRALR